MEELADKLGFVRSPLLGPCNFHNKPMHRHFYRPVYFWIFFREKGQHQSTRARFGKKKQCGLTWTCRHHFDMSTLIRTWGCNWSLRFQWGTEFEIKIDRSENAVTGIWGSCRLSAMDSWFRPNFSISLPLSVSYLLFLCFTVLRESHCTTRVWRVKERLYQLFEVFQHEFANLSECRVKATKNCSFSFFSFR